MSANALNVRPGTSTDTFRRQPVHARGEGPWSEAIATVKEIFRLNPASVEGGIELSRPRLAIHHNTGSLNAARQTVACDVACAPALIANPGRDLHVNPTISLRLAEQQDAAVKAARIGLGHHPQNAAPLTNLGTALQAAAYEQALQIPLGLTEAKNDTARQPPIDDATTAVRVQCEEPPYPRWPHADPLDISILWSVILQTMVPHGTIATNFHRNAPEILIADRDTGREAMTYPPPRFTGHDSQRTQQ